jgi:exosortase F-associated protein
MLNSIISLGILYVVFKDKNIIKFSTFIYVVAFIILMAIYLYFVVNPKQEDYYLFFNVRRFIIQPIILMVLLPAFYYNKLKT